MESGKSCLINDILLFIFLYILYMVIVLRFGQSCMTSGPFARGELAGWKIVQMASEELTEKAGLVSI